MPPGMERTPLGDRSLPGVTDENLHLVMDALAAHRVPAFVVRTRSLTRHCVGVYAEHRDRAVQALARELGEQPVYVRRLDPQGAGPVRRIGALAAGPEGEDVSVLRVCRPFTTVGGELKGGFDRGCDVEFWERDPVHPRVRQAPRRNVAARVIDESELAPVDVEVAGRRYPTPAVFTRRMLTDITFPIDVVYSWVDGEDPAWQEKYRRWRPDTSGGPADSADSADSATPHPTALGAQRFRSRDELRYSLRSLEMFAPWVRNVFLITDDQVPDWLDPDAPGITVVSHTELFDRAALPTFSSRVISSYVHRLEGLAEHFLYFNDDVFLGRPVSPYTFFTPPGQVRLFPGGVQRPFGPPSPEWEPHENSAITMRALLERDHGVTLSHGWRHTPMSLLRSALAEQEERYPEEYARTRAHRFRSTGDIEPVQLFQYRAMALGTGVVSEVDYQYVNLGDHEQTPRLRELGDRRDHDVFCLNDTGTGQAPIADEVVREVLATYFPIPSRFERRAER